jgi:hypothetical protein
MNMHNGNGHHGGVGLNVIGMDRALQLVSAFGRYNLDFPSRLVGKLLQRVDILPGAPPGIMVYALSTLSWFWVPVILFAINVAPNRIAFTLQYAHQMVMQSGGLFDMQVLVDTVNQMMTNGIFQLGSHEISNMNGVRTSGSRPGCPYIQSAAQDRLIELLNNHAPALMGHISDWIQHLYACEVTSMQTQAPVGPAYDVDPWLPHHYGLNGHVMYMSAPGRQLMVYIQAGPVAPRYLCRDIMSEIQELTAEQSAWNRLSLAGRPTASVSAHTGTSCHELLLIRRRIMNICAGHCGSANGS